jgi:hypothetical protein
MESQRSHGNFQKLVKKEGGSSGRKNKRPEEVRS